MLHFPHQGKIVIVDQRTFFFSNSSNGNVPYVGNINIPYESVGVGIFKYSSLMGSFSLPPFNFTSINMISTCHDPGVIPCPDQIEIFFNVMSLSPVEKAYQVVISNFVKTS